LLSTPFYCKAEKRGRYWGLLLLGLVTVGACIGCALIAAHKKSGFFVAMIGGRWCMVVSLCNERPLAVALRCLIIVFVSQWVTYAASISGCAVA
jgi:hypothetical protein